MRVRDEVTAEKLRGGFYSPPALVQRCLERVVDLLPDSDEVDLLEPAAGDGSFLRGLRNGPLRVRRVTAVELLEAEAAKARCVMVDDGVPGEVVEGDFVGWAASTGEMFDAAVGNPPFVRFQFVTADVRRSADQLAARLDTAFGGVSNLWIPVFLGALAHLRPGGAFAFIIPTESFTGVSAGVVRTWLASNVDELHADLFPPGSFPGVLQEVVVLSGVRRAIPQAGTCLRMAEHQRYGPALTWEHFVPPSGDPWTRYLLRPALLEVLRAASAVDRVVRFGDVARFEVAAVTGANEYFSVDEATVTEYGLHPWVRPLLPRIRHAQGLRYTAADHEQATAAGARTALLDFSAERPSPLDSPGAAAYIAHGETQKLTLRYKTRIRDPWYRVPGIRPGELMLSKRAHLFPRVVLNDLGAVTTDTIYRGRVLAPSVVSAQEVAANFHNSLTLLSAEVEGRNFGGGVMELVPSEIQRLRFPMMPSRPGDLDALDAVARGAADPEQLIDATDARLETMPGFTPDMVQSLREARLLLQSRRLERAAVPTRLVPVEHDSRPAVDLGIATAAS